MRNLTIQQSLLADNDFTNNRALPCVMKRAKKKDFDIEGGVSGLEKLKKPTNRIQDKWDRSERTSLKKEQIYFCSWGNHFQSQCSYKNAKCHT